MQIFLIRHPAPAVPTSVCYGRTDVALSDHAIVVLDKTAATLKLQLPPDIPVYSSPLRRCRQLTEKLHPLPIFDDRLTEMHFGRWEMRAWNEVPRHELNAWATDPLHFVIPGGESVVQLQQRVLSFVQELDKPAVALITHAGVMKILAGHTGNLSSAEWMQLHFDYGSLHVVNFA